MYNVATLRSAFSGVVGFLQANLPQVPLITAPLTTSTSGIYVQDKHALVTLENIWYSAPDFGIKNYPLWVTGINYLTGQAVNDGGSLFIAKNNITPSVVAPHSDAANWNAFNPFQSFLLQKYNQGITNGFAEVVKMFKLQDSGKALLERQQLFRGGGLLTEVIVPSDSFVGFEILVQQAEGIMLCIDEIGLQFTEDQLLDIYVYHSSFPKQNIYKVSAQTGGSSSFYWRDVVAQAIQLIYLQQNTQGTYVFGYYEADLAAGNQAISKNWDCSSAPCAGCNGSDLIDYNRWSRYSAFRNIKVSASGCDLVTRTLPDLSKAVYDSSTNWGINLSLTVRCDITNFIVYSKTLYADFIASQVALELLKTIALSTRLDPAMAQAKILARAELNLSEKSAYINQYKDSLNALKIDMSGFSSACQPCDKQDNKKTGKWRSV